MFAVSHRNCESFGEVPASIKALVDCRLSTPIDILAVAHRNFKKLVVCFVAASVAFGCSADYLIWIPRSSSAEPLYRFIEDGKAGYIDANGHVVVPPQLTLRWV
jgi:hypothetical protein